MAELPRIVQQRLKAGVPAEPHPDADLLTAFAERSLSERDRARIMQHLAVCGDCRDIVALALPEETETRIDVRAGGGANWLRWPALRWAAVAAGLAVVSVATLEYRHDKVQTAAYVARQQQSDVKLEAPAPEKIAGPNEGGPAASNPQKALSLGTPAAAKKPAPPSTSAAGQIGGMTARVLSRPDEAKNLKIATNEPPRGLPFAGMKTAPQAMRRQATANPTPPTSAMTQGVEVSGAAPLRTRTANLDRMQTGQTQSSQGQNEVVEVDTDETVGKAKPLQAPAAPAPPPPMHADAAVLQKPAAAAWTITSSGGLQRSLDGGITWADVNPAAASAGMAANRSAAAKINTKTMPAPAVFRAVAANGSEVWAGGSAGLLYHSADSGDHWSLVVPSSSGSTLSGDVTSIQFPDAQHGRISTSTGEVWTTADSGRTWKK